MTTLARPGGAPSSGADEHPDAPRHAAEAPAEISRFAAWRASWAVALRMARRDVRRHKGRSALIIVMVTVPTALLSLVLTLALTSDIRGAETIPMLMGNGQALIEGPDSSRVLQGPDPARGFGGSEGAARPIPGYDPERSGEENSEAIAALIGGAPVSAVRHFDARLTVDERRVRVSALALDGRVGLGDKLELVSGRWPAGADEALVTASGVDSGLPSTGQQTLSIAGSDRTLAIVGVARAASLYDTVGLVTAVEPPDLEQSYGGWIVRGTDPVTWADVRTLNEYGLRVSSASVLRDPPAISELPAEVQESASGEDSQMRLIAGMGGAMLLIITTLLVGPAFAVSAARQRRTLALAASNGATTAVLRRTVLASALVLGATSALAGTALGVALTPLLIRGLNRWADYGVDAPLDIRWVLLGGIALCAVVSTLIAALLPARRLGRLDIVGVMRGQAVSPPPSKVVLAVGAVLSALGALVILGSTGVAGLPSVTRLLGIQTGGDYAVTVGAVVLIVGSLFLVPVALAGIGRLGSHLPTTLRIAARDLARHRSRSAPSVAAVLAAVAGLSFGLTGLASDTEESRRTYIPVTLPGEVVVRAWAEPITADAIRAAAPGLIVTENVAAGAVDPMNGLDAVPTEPYRLEFVSIVPPGCTAARTISDPEWDAAENARYLAAEEAGTTDSFVFGTAPCSTGGTTYGGTGSTLLLPAEEIVRRLGLDAAQADAVRAGAVITRALSPATASGDQVRVARGTFVIDPNATGPTDPQVEVLQEASLPAIQLAESAQTEGKMLGASLMLASDSVVTTGWPSRPESFTVRDAAGAPVTQEAVERLRAALGDGFEVSVERGFTRDDRIVVAALLGVFALLILVITLTSTALTVAEQQSDQATLAALGATRGTRRLMAGAAAFLLAAVGCVLGVAVGLVPGIAISRALTSAGWDPVNGVPEGQETILVIPWLSLLIVGVLVPMVAGAIAWAGIRKAPQITRRST
ncbi:MAG TPA: FtsX-like permease family protein [Ornithinibacter sp.]|jgi:putative ABC transport system permease protein|uniref:FtsX-like permease family protein n=1 Tax=Ornithinibacter sp. TaxID=2862748 RepID=UPI002BDAF8AA|nr:FtsX-like permease family protein [Ornithinibacter sp.]HNV42174.1 FtsX-like permease family protein [Ornithinibacter sp.]HOB79947.1 FtsX-like permease family protein [Ornithinibacter sp.]HOT57237.1 FtsX-like permease family protein [Ornithinibacter sp.]HPV91033.1 FtsX-like permease family protein [Ornithinibacter sp.]HQA14044.1 FtsX-like permease family protein [Ornithinibacter sp.]